MKLLAVISFLLSSLILRAQILPDSFIRPNNIYEVTTVKTFLIKSSSGDSRQKINQTVIYNKQGYPVKFTETTHFNDGTGKDNFITTYFYQDTLLKRMESKASARGIVSKSFEARDYTFDELHRRTSLLTIDENKR